MGYHVVPPLRSETLMADQKRSNRIPLEGASIAGTKAWEKPEADSLDRKLAPLRLHVVFLVHDTERCRPGNFEKCERIGKDFRMKTSRSIICLASNDLTVLAAASSSTFFLSVKRTARIDKRNTFQSSKVATS